VDKIVLSGITDFGPGLSLILREARRVLKKNGRLFISLGNNPQGFKLISRVRSKLSSKNSIDKIATMITQQNLLIDKNFILDNDQVYLEIVKLESDYLKRKIVI
jgi:SAM-dependent methyltransferase